MVPPVLIFHKSSVSSPQPLSHKQYLESLDLHLLNSALVTLDNLRKLNNRLLEGSYLVLHLLIDAFFTAGFSHELGHDASQL